MLIDTAEIHVASGRGGDGMVHFRREKYVPRGGPDGGNGGHGGDLILEANPKLNTLANFRYQQKFKADDGENGGISDRTGKSAQALVVAVPTGTVVFDAESGAVLGDLVEPGQRLVICQGGRGGRGNARFVNSRKQAPRIAERGEPGSEKQLRLELRLIADIALVGAPNAGKSTFLAAVTRAKPKIAPYPFTTLEPNLGVAVLDDETTLVLADIPGLIEGAHLGIGLGHDFLRHIQRTRVLIHLLDGSAEDPLLDYAQINSELALFDERLADKPQVVVINKIDIPEVRERLPELKANFAKRKIDIYTISGMTGENVRPVLYKAAELLQTAPPPEIPTVPVYRMETDPKAFTIKSSPEGWQVRGQAIERAAEMTYWEYFDSVRRFQRILAALGVEKALRDAGVQTGDTVFIGEYELEWQE